MSNPNLKKIATALQKNKGFIEEGIKNPDSVLQKIGVRFDQMTDAERHRAQGFLAAIKRLSPDQKKTVITGLVEEYA